MSNKILLTFAAVVTTLSFAHAQSHQYSLFHPVPADSVREEMETDRPNVTESPYTVDAGHIQYEASLLNLERKHTEEGLQRTWLVNHADIKLGLLQGTNLHIVFETYGDQAIKSGNHTDESKHGVGDLGLRLKQNIYGNYHGNFSAALMPYITFPTGQYEDSHSVETGLMIPLALKLPNDWKLGMQIEGDYLNNDAEPGRHAELLQSLVISKILFDKLEIFGETYYTRDFAHHSTHSYIDTALEYALSDNFKIDIGLNHGLQRDAGDNYFVGIAFRK